MRIVVTTVYEDVSDAGAMEWARQSILTQLGKCMTADQLDKMAMDIIGGLPVQATGQPVIGCDDPTHDHSSEEGVTINTTWRVHR